MAYMNARPHVRSGPPLPRALPAALLLALVCARAGAQAPPLRGGVEASTVPASQAGLFQQSNLFLNISKNSERSRVGLDYSMKWDFSDLLSFRPSLSTLLTEVKALTSWDITRNTRLNYYGFKTNPWRLIIAHEDPPPAAAAEGPTGGGVVNRAAAGPRKRLRLSVSPLVDDIKLNLEDSLREMLLRGSLRNLSPQWERAGKDGRREFVRDVLSLGIWDAPLPLIRESRGGLEYLSESPAPRAGAGARP